MKRRVKLTGILVGLLLIAGAEEVFAQANFYEGKAIRFIVGFSAGGGYDAYTRTIARHMGKHVPGNPVFVVDNMAGAGSLISANYVYKAAKPDGLTIGHFIGGLFLQQLLGKPGIEFDSLKFTDPDKWIASKQVVKFGGVSTGSGTDDFPNLLKATIGLPIQMVSGYKGTADIRLAFNSGEVAGISNSWESMKSTWKKELESGDLTMVLQVTSKPHPELAKVPLAVNLAKTEEAKKLIQTVERVHGPSVRPYVVPPGTPKDRVQILRRAFMDTMKDSAFLAEAKKATLDINAADGAELEQNVKDIFKLESSLITKLKEILR